MNKKIIFIIIFVIVVFIFIVIKPKKLNNKSIENNIQKSNKNVTITESDFGQYIVTKEDGTQIITNTLEEAEWYEFDSNYNPEPIHIE